MASSPAAGHDTPFSNAFLVLAESTLPDPERVTAVAREKGISLEVDPATAEPGGQVQFYDHDGERVMMLMLMGFPHPDAAHPSLVAGPTSPDHEVAATAPDHVIVTVFDASPEPRVLDAKAALLTGVLVECLPCVGAMLGHGRLLHRPKMFDDIDAELYAHRLPVQVCVDVLFDRDSESTLSAHTHGLSRYGHEEILVIATPAEAEFETAFELALDLAAWLLASPAAALNEGDAVGRLAHMDERILVRRGPSPIAPEQQVILLRLPAGGRVNGHTAAQIRMRRRDAFVHCPACGWVPRANDGWQCSCGKVWNTFDTRGTCPACDHTWEDTQCLACHDWAPHAEWYIR